METIKEIKKELKIKDADIAEMFGYKNAVAYATSTAKPRIEKGIENMYEKIIKSKKVEEKPVRIYTNGKSLFTLENYSKTAGVSHVHNITLHSEVSLLKKRAMHERGQLHYIYGTGDRKVLAGILLNRKMDFEDFEIK